MQVIVLLDKGQISTLCYLLHLSLVTFVTKYNMTEHFEIIYTIKCFYHIKETLKFRRAFNDRYGTFGRLLH